MYSEFVEAEIETSHHEYDAFAYDKDLMIVVDIGTCSGLYEAFNYPIYPDSMICAGDIVNGGIDSCYGDSGGPLVMDDIDMQVGVVSFGEGMNLHHVEFSYCLF